MDLLTTAPNSERAEDPVDPAGPLIAAPPTAEPLTAEPDAGGDEADPADAVLPFPGAAHPGPGYPGPAAASALPSSSPPPPGAPPEGPPSSGPPPEGPPPPAGGWDAPPPPPPPPADHPRRTLRRDPHRRILGGVAAGLAEYIEIDVAIVRVAFVVLAILFGSGVLLYLAAWLLIPARDTDKAVIHDLVESRPRRRSLVALVLGAVIAVIALSNLFSSGPWWPHWDHGFGGFGFFFGLLALLLAGVLVGASGRRDGSPVRWVLLTSLITVLAVLAVAVATVFSIEALSGVPLRGGIGDVQWRPTAPSQVAHSYRLAIGNMDVDLSDVAFPPGTTHIDASVGIGHLLVELPPGPAVSVTAHAGTGDVQMFGTDNGGFGTNRTMSQPAVTGATPKVHIVLDAQAGVGQVQVMRDGP